jgi:hypothetical protein
MGAGRPKPGSANGAGRIRKRGISPDHGRYRVATGSETSTGAITVWNAGSEERGGLGRVPLRRVACLIRAALSRPFFGPVCADLLRIGCARLRRLLAAGAL